jgi:hypothetical protein
MALMGFGMDKHEMSMGGAPGSGSAGAGGFGAPS